MLGCLVKATLTACLTAASVCYRHGPVSTPLLPPSLPPCIHLSFIAVPCNESVVCDDGSTCCKLPAGTWTCCPLPEAVCCEDHLHCCPHGTICNLAAFTCDYATGNALVPWLANTPVFPLLTDNNKCDESTSCPGSSTCCKTAGGTWACCPLPQLELSEVGWRAFVNSSFQFFPQILDWIQVWTLTWPF
uniref:Granulins domain-containing protein n=1 Tax=Monopterus albus TaxID=43700 RepID=A0A3Q3IYS9_MONAL